ncbi:hypothetical protein MQE36_05350 [Zhouia spongiae]|uniref:Lipoprotein n=1 Tax=Zhouia spongiae TaxID=2202721 RepID=A0ABY3YPL3_9FLAO|nr:hypothetical protein [Zhouia spongiae]UNY99770.1 hypothetical protein MQE36_05350 [Zhouia spongiae]
MKFRFGIKVLMFFVLISCNKDLKFDAEKWKSAGGENITLEIRANMVADLIESGTLLNKNESEIINLIDKPSKLNNGESENIKYFPVQEKYGTDTDPEEMIFLKIKFNEEGASKSVELYSTK